MQTSGSPQLCFLRTEKFTLNLIGAYIKHTDHVITAELQGIFTRKTSKIEGKLKVSSLGRYLLCLTAATRSGPENMENRLSPLAEDVSSLELAESP